MKDRIQIDGVWYVREAEPQPEFIDVKIHTSLSAHYENDDKQNFVPYVNLKSFLVIKLLQHNCFCQKSC